MSNSDDDDELPEVGTSVQTQKKRVSLQPSSDILARRAKEMEIPNLLEEYKKNNLSVLSDTESEADIKAAENFLKIGSERALINPCHPGCDVLEKKLLGCAFNEESLSLRNLTTTYDIPKKLLPFLMMDKTKFHSYLENGFVGIVSDSEYVNTMCRYMLMLLSVADSYSLLQACVNGIRSMKDGWQPRIQDFLVVFNNLGIRLEILYSFEIPAKTHNKSEIVQPFVSSRNLEKVLDVLFFVSDKLPSDCSPNELYSLLRTLVLITLDSSLSNCSVLHSVASCISCLVKYMPEDKWKPAYISKVLFKTTDHFHNLAFVCTFVLTTGDRCKKLATIIAFAVLHKLLANLDNLSEVDGEKDINFEWPTVTVDTEGIDSLCPSNTRSVSSPSSECIPSPPDLVKELEACKEKSVDFNMKETDKSDINKCVNQDKMLSDQDDSRQKVVCSHREEDMFVEDVTLKDIRLLITGHKSIKNMDTYSLYIFCNLLFHCIKSEKVTKESLEHMEYLISVLGNVLSSVTSSLKSTDMPKLGEQLARNLAMWIMLCNTFHTFNYNEDC